MIIILFFMLTSCATFKKVAILAGEKIIERYKKVRTEEGTEFIKRRANKYIRSEIKTDKGLTIYELIEGETQ